METINQWAAIAWQYRDETLEIIGGVVTAATALAHALRLLVIWLGKLALKTETKADDHVLGIAERALGPVVVGLDKTYRLLRPVSVRGFGDKVKERIEPNGEWQVVKKLSTRPPPPPPPPASAKGKS